MHLHALVFLIFLLFSLISQADKCSTIDLSSDLGPTRHQGDTSWCFAHSAADLVSQALKVRISAMDLATNYLLTDLNQFKNHKNPGYEHWITANPEFYKRTEHWRTEEMSSYLPERILTYLGLYNLGGMDQDAILMTNLKGFCRDSELPGGPKNYDSYLKSIDQIKKDPSLTKKCLQESLKKYKKMGSITKPNSEELARIFQCFVDSKCQNRITPSQLLLADGLELAGSYPEFLEKIKSGKINAQKANDQLFDKVDQVLEQGQVLSFGWDSSNIYASDSSLSDHASVITGRKMINGTCHYRIRDNYGAKCYPMQTHISPSSCDPTTGAIWVKRADLPSIYAIVWIKKNAQP